MKFYFGRLDGNVADLSGISTLLYSSSMNKVIPFGSKETAYKTNAIAENLNLKVAFVERVRADIFRSPECLNNVLGDDSERQSRWFEARHRWTY